MVKLIIKVNMFAINQDVVLIKDKNKPEIIRADLKELSQIPLNYTWGKDLEEISIYGNKNYIEQLAYELLQNITRHYSNGNVRIKINGEVFNQ